MTAAELDEAVLRVARGGLVAYPTETVFGLGADARSDAALEALAAWKGRRDDQPISILVDEAGALDELGFDVPPGARRVAEALWPGPLTLVLPCAGGFARGVARRDDGAVGVRCSPHPVAARLARRLAREKLGPLTATSLNRSGEPPAASGAAARALCAGAEAPLVVDGPPAPEGAASTVLDVTGPEPVVLREGAVDRARLEACLERPLA